MKSSNSTNKRSRSFTAFGMILIAAIMMFATLTAPSVNSQKSTVNTVETIEKSSVEVNLARIINKYSKKTTWNQAQTKASKIVNAVITGSDIASAISVVLGFLSFGVVTAITWAARMSLKWYIKKKGRRQAVLW